MSQETKRAPDITKNSSREAPREQNGEPRVVKGTQLETKGGSRGPRAIQMVLKASRTIPVGHLLEVQDSDNQGGPIQRILMPLSKDFDAPDKGFCNSKPATVFVTCRF